ncbi:MAG: paraquat-inducible protein B [Planctomycetota bacterium]|nr:MAG: paraquat-inducible protein B [Planctomycetota bacterium]
MSASTTNHWKLGAFVVSGVTLAIVALVWLGNAQFDREITTCRAYFKESVNGLEVGSPVKLRGVKIGSVARIGFAPDGRAVEVQLDGYRDAMRRLGLEGAYEDPTRPHAGLENVYAQLASSGITGGKYILVDFIDADKGAPALNQFDFPLGDDVMVTAQSSLESLEQLFVHAARTLPDTLDDLSGMAGKARELIDSIDFATTQSSIEEMAATIRDQAKALDVAGLQTDLDTTLLEGRDTLIALREVADFLLERRDQLGVMVDDLGSVAETLDRELGASRLSDTAAGLRNATDSVIGVADNANDMTREARRLLDELNGSAFELAETLRALRMLADLLERDPGALLRGRESPSPAPRTP